MKQIIIEDYRNFDPNLCCNGGKYGFTDIYTEQPDGSFVVYHDTTSDLDWCTKCGNFGHLARECDFDRTYTADEVKRIIEDSSNITGIKIFIECYNIQTKRIGNGIFRAITQKNNKLLSSSVIALKRALKSNLKRNERNITNEIQRF